MISQLIDLKSQHIADEVKKVDDKVKKNITDIVTAKNSLLHNKSVLDDLEREASFNRGFYYYSQQSYFLSEPKSKSFTRNGGAIYAWISTGIYNDINNTDLSSVNNSNNNSPTLLNKNNRLGVQGINNTTIYTERIYKTKFTKQSKKFELSLHYNGDNSYLFVNESQELKFKSSANYLDRNLLCVGNISSDWSLTNVTKTGLYGNFCDFVIDYVGINNEKTIYDIHRYLMKKHNI